MNKPLEPVERPRLTRQFENGKHRKLTLVEAPLGYGKTTLIRRWMELLHADRVATSYVTLDGVDADASRMIVHALMRLINATGPSAADQSPNPRIHDLDIAMLLDRLAGLRERCCLIVDDFHNADEKSSQLVHSLLHHSPKQFHLIIGSRETPRFPLTKLRMANLVSDFEISDLRFNIDEAATLFRGALPLTEVQALVSRAEGWITALHLLKQSGQSTQSSPPDFDQLSEFADYLNEQYFERLEPDQQELLLSTAHISRIDGDIVNRLTGRSDGWHALSRLARTHALIFTDNGGHIPSYRYHQLLRDFLKSKQHLVGKADLLKLHAKAGEWYFEQQELYLAMRHMCLAGEPGRASDMLLQSGGTQYGMLHGAARLAPCLDLLPSALNYANHRLITARAYLFLKVGRLNDAADLLKDVRAMSTQTDRKLEREIVLVEAHLRIYQDTPISHRQIEALEHMIASTPSTDPLMRGLLSNFLCIFLIEHGDFARARSLGDNAMAYYKDISAEHLQFFMHLHQSTIDLEQGDTKSAAKKRAQAMEICTSSFSFDPSLKAIADVYLCEVELEQGNIDGLTEKLLHALERIDRNEGWNLLYLAGYESCLSMMIADASHEDAAELLENARAMVTRRGLQLFSNQLLIMELDLAIRAGAEQEAARLERIIRELVSTNKFERNLRWRGRIRAALAIAQAELARGDPRAALSRVDGLVSICDQQGLQRMRLRALIRKFLLEVVLESQDAAEATLRTFLNLSAEQGAFGAILRDRADFIAGVRWIVAANGLGGFSQIQIRNLANLLWQAAGRPSGQANILAELLTVKEFEVLAELTKGHANKVIARSLQISESTVKFHLQNIYNKIGVNSRKLAVEIAHVHGLRTNT